MESLQAGGLPQHTRTTIPTRLTKQATPPSDCDALRWKIETTKLKQWPKMSGPLRIDNMNADIANIRKWDK